MDCTIAYEKAKANKHSFYLYYLYQSLSALNQIESFRYRIEGGDVWLYERIHSSATALRKDETFAFTFFPYTDTFEEFIASAQKQMDLVENTSGLFINENAGRPDVIHYSAIPWIHFSSISHARQFKSADSAPKMTFGKVNTEHSTKTLPVSIHGHHALMDGLHIGKYLELYQTLLNQ